MTRFFTPTDIVNLALALASLAVAVWAVFIARSSLKQAEQVAAQERRDWVQRQWFELYFKADEFYDALDRFQQKYGTLDQTLRGMVGLELDALMMQVRRLHSTAVVFPQNPTVKQLFDATAVFADKNEAFSGERLEMIFEAVEALRQNALVDPSVLEVTQSKQRPRSRRRR